MLAIAKPIIIEGAKEGAKLIVSAAVVYGTIAAVLGGAYAATKFFRRDNKPTEQTPAQAS